MGILVQTANDTKSIFTHLVSAIAILDSACSLSCSRESELVAYKMNDHTVAFA